MNQYEPILKEIAFGMLEKAGQDLRKLIHTYTGLDTVKLAKL